MTSWKRQTCAEGKRMMACHACRGAGSSRWSTGDFFWGQWNYSMWNRNGEYKMLSICQRANSDVFKFKKKKSLRWSGIPLNEMQNMTKESSCIKNAWNRLSKGVGEMAFYWRECAQRHGVWRAGWCWQDVKLDTAERKKNNAVRLLVTSDRGFCDMNRAAEMQETQVLPQSPQVGRRRQNLLTQL